MKHFTSFCHCLLQAAELDKEPEYWNAQARGTLEAALRLQPQAHRAKNLILFLGDGKANLVRMMSEVETLNDRHRQICSKSDKKSNKAVRGMPLSTCDFQWGDVKACQYLRYLICYIYYI